MGFFSPFGQQVCFAIMADHVTRANANESHRCPDANDSTLNSMVQKAVPDMLTEYAKAMRKAQPKSGDEILRFSRDYFDGQVAERCVQPSAM